MQATLGGWTGDAPTTASVLQTDRFDSDRLARELSFVLNGATIAAARRPQGSDRCTKSSSARCRRSPRV